MPIQISCPSCSTQLRVPDNLLGQSVRCPTCQKTFTAAAPNEAPPPPEPPESASGGMQTDESKAKPRQRREKVREEDDQPRRSRPSPPSGDFAPARGGLIMGLGIGSVATGGVSILASLCMCLHPILGIIPFGLAIVALGLGIPTLIMANRDKASIRAGTMDPAGEGQTKTGWICALIGIILGALELMCSAVLLILGCLGVAALTMSNPN